MGNLRYRTGVVVALAGIGFAGMAAAAPGARVAEVGLQVPGARMTAAEKQAVLDRVGEILRTQPMAPAVDVTMWDKVLADSKARFDAAENVDTFAWTLKYAMQDLHLFGLRVLTPKQAQSRSRGPRIGIGIKHNGLDAPLKGGLQITEVMAGAPAEMASIKSGDTILKVDGVVLTTTEQLRGKDGSAVVLTVRRAAAGVELGAGEEAAAGAGLTEEITVTRGRLPILNPATFAQVDAETAYIRVPSFGSEYESKRVEELFRQAAGSKALIIDLRSTDDGDLVNIDHFLGLTLPAGTEYGVTFDSDSVKDYAAATGKDARDILEGARLAGEDGDHAILLQLRAMRRDTTQDKPNTLALVAWAPSRLKVGRNPVEPFTGKIVVLTEFWSSVGAQIVALALRELHNPPALVAGRAPIFSRGLQTELELPSGLRMTVPTAEYVSIKGCAIGRGGVSPDIKYEEPDRRWEPSPEEDELVLQVLSELKKER